MADLFLSYARADREKIEGLAAALEAEGYSVWWDRHIEAGAEFSKDIEQALGEAKAVIVAWSKDANASRWVKDEASAAAEQGKLVPLRLDAEHAPMGFRQYHAVDFSEWKGETGAPEYRDLLRAVRSHAAARAVGEDAPPAAPARIGVRAWTALIVSAVAALVIAIAVVSGGRETADADKRAAAAPARAVRAAAIKGNKTVAVLPFASRSANPEDAYFAEGVHDDLLAQLSKIGALQVISRTSVLGYAQTTKKIPEIAVELGAAVVMEGAVQRAGDRVRINVQLIDGETDAHLWAETFDRELTVENLLDIQSEITRAIAAALESVLADGDEEQLGKAPPTQNLAAYEAYVRGKIAAVWGTGLEGHLKAIEAFDQAIALDPGFAAPYATKAGYQASLYRYFGYGEAMKAAAEASLAKAISLAPDSLDVMVDEGYVYMHGPQDFARAADAFDRVLARSPNHGSAWTGKALAARGAGRFDEAITAFKKAIELDPRNIQYPGELADTYLLLGRFGDAEAALERAKAIDPDAPPVAIYSAFLHWRRGDANAAFDVLDKPQANWPDYIYAQRAIIAFDTGDREKIVRSLSEWPAEKRIVGSYAEVYPLLQGEAHLVLGEAEQAQEIVRGVKERLAASDNPYPAGWSPNAGYIPVQVPGYLRDLEGVRAAVADYEAHPNPDVWSHNRIYYLIAEAFAFAGDAGAAFDYVERIADLFGPSVYLSIVQEPAFDGLRDHPRYLALKDAYDAWAKQTEPWP